MTRFLRNTTSYLRLVATLKSFSRFSNLQVNKDETEIFAIGSHRLDQRNYAHKVRTSVKTLGIVFDYIVSSRMKANFEAVQRYNKYVETILHVLDIQSMILAQRVMVLKRFTNKDYNSSWKITLNYFLSQVGGEFVLKCNFDTRQLPI